MLTRATSSSNSDRGKHHIQFHELMAAWHLKMTLPLLVAVLAALFCTCPLSFVHGMTIPRRTSNSKSDGGGSGTSGRPGSSRSSPMRQTTAQTKNKSWYNKRRSGIRVASGGTKPPQWEREGDALFLDPSVGRQRHSDGSINEQRGGPLSYCQARDLLSKYEENSLDGDDGHVKLQAKVKPLQVPADSSDDDKPFLWGGLSVGPFWKTRLVQAGYNSPTPIQVQSFKVIVDGEENACIASPTGSGKSLAYLLPILTSTSAAKQPQQFTSTIGKVWLLTPSMELAFQQQRMVNHLIHGQAVQAIEGHSSTLHVLCYPDSEVASDGTPAPASLYPLLSAINSICPDSPPILAGTPKRFAQLRQEMKTILRLKTTDTDGIPKSLQRLAAALDRNLQKLILDEADRLLRTNPTLPTTTATSFSGNSKTKTTKPVAQDLLASLLWEASALPHRSRLQVICASATVGRSLRRQLMITMGAPSMDKAAVLVTADVRTKKHADARKSSLLPANLHHSFRLIEEPTNGDHDVGEEVDLLLRELSRTLDDLAVAPSLIFPGKVGVERVREFLINELHFQDIRGLPSSSVSSIDANGGDAPTGDAAGDDTEGGTWRETPLYVVKERLGRGLDLPEIRNVLLLGVPVNAASYAHLAGRTARHDAAGRAITICHPREADDLASIADILGLKFSCLNKGR